MQRGHARAQVRPRSRTHHCRCAKPSRKNVSPARKAAAPGAAAILRLLLPCQEGRGARALLRQALPPTGSLLLAILMLLLAMQL